MCVMLAALCDLLRFIIISSVHCALPLSISLHTQNIGTENFLVGKSYGNFDTGIVKCEGSFSARAKINSLIKRKYVIYKFPLYEVAAMCMLLPK